MNRVVDLDSLTSAERLKLVEDLWDQIAADGAAVPVTDAQRRELERRLADHRDAPDDVIPWETVKSRNGK